MSINETPSQNEDLRNNDGPTDEDNGIQRTLNSKNFKYLQQEENVIVEKIQSENSLEDLVDNFEYQGEEQESQVPPQCENIVTQGRVSDVLREKSKSQLAM